VRPKYPKGQADKGNIGLSSKGIYFSFACPYEIYFVWGTFPKDVSHFSIDNTVRLFTKLKGIL
jgi:hypothetical protein